MHAHNCGCQHDLRHCPCCDTVYCGKCGKEWKQQVWHYTPYTITWASTNSEPIRYDTTITCSHQGEHS